MSTFMTTSPARFRSTVPTPRPLSPSMTRRPSLMTICPLPVDTPRPLLDRTSYEPSSRIVRVTSSRSEPGRYTVPCHVPVSDLTSDTATGVTGPMLAQPTSETDDATTTVTARILQTSRRLLDVIAPPVRTEDGVSQQATECVPRLADSGVSRKARIALNVFLSPE